MARTKDTNKDETPITTQAQQENLDLRPDDNKDTTTSSEAQGEAEAKANEQSGAPDTSGAPKSEDAPEVGPTPETPAVTSATAGPEAGVTTSGTNDTSGTTESLDSTYGVPGADGTQRNPNPTSDQVSGMDQMPGHTPDDEKAREEYVTWVLTGPRCTTQYCNLPEGHTEGDIQPEHGWVNVSA